MDFSQRNDRVRWLRVTFAGGLLTVVAVMVFSIFSGGSFSHEAGVYEEIARQLIANTTEGRQAIVSSVWWPPFCTLVRLPFVFLFPDDGFPWASVSIAALSGFFVLSFLWRCSIDLTGWVRTALICGMLAGCTFFLSELVSGSTILLVAALAVFSADSLARWFVGRSVRALVYFAACSAVICGLSPELTVWVGAMILVFIIDLVRSRSMSKKQKESVLIIGIMPTAYILSLWFLMNWLIMGDVLYFLKPLWKVNLLPALESGGGAKLGLLHLACGLIPAFTAGISAGSRNRTGVLWSMFALLMFLSVLLFRHVGMLWRDTHILGVLPIFVFFTSVASMGHVGGGVVAGWRKLLIVLPLAVLVLSYADSTRKEDIEVAEPQLPLIERHVIGRSRYAKVFVCGYDSFELLRGTKSDVFAHALDFNFNKSKNDYKGHDLFIMVKKPVGRGSGDSIHWKHMDIYTLGSEETLYDADWGEWRLFQVIQPPRESR